MTKQTAPVLVVIGAVRGAAVMNARYAILPVYGIVTPKTTVQTRVVTGAQTFARLARLTALHTRALNALHHNCGVAI
jgi:hypothetical protein